ncbi:5'-nucleotidase [Pseudidiomarina planktonica]|uniref:5'-nucleotidase n=2 Tax=Pseudidiomarina planktonica TaxID=1323738 RepID=A0A1Y6F151_9GAMM|nr:5'-nucleotidase [Pseudidiomarina planktonica]
MVIGFQQKGDSMNAQFKLLALATALATTVACSNMAPDTAATQPATASGATNFELTIAHVNDHHSNLDAHSRTSLQLDGESVRVESGGFARVAAMIDRISSANRHVLKLHAGDAITGSLYYTLFQGKADAAMMNHVCFDGFVLGNHEFDNGDAGLKKFLNALAKGDCNTPVLAANVKPEVGVSPLTPRGRWDSFQPYQIYNLGGQKVGVIGLDIAVKTKQSSQPDATTTFADERETAEHYIAELQRYGVGKIILLTHYQYSNDLALARALPAVDAIIGGDSHTLLGDFNSYGLDSDGPYPTQITNADGEPVCVAHAYEYSKVVGELQLQFNGDAISSCGGRPHFLLSEEAPAAFDDTGLFTRIAPQASAVAVRDTFAKDVDVLTQQVIARAPERLCMQRMGVISREQCGSAGQSDMHQLVAQAFLRSVPAADFSLQNGGGVRGELPAGSISLGDAYRILPFSNTLVTVDLTGAEVKQLLEQTMAYTLSDAGSDGSYPHGANIRFDVDLSAADGNRVSAIQTRTEQGWQPLNNDQRYSMVTNSFVANGSDGWLLLGELSEQGRVEDTYIEYAQSFIDWLRAQDQVTRPGQHSTINYTPVQP